MNKGCMMYDSIIIDCNDETRDNKTFQLEGKESITGNVEPSAWRHLLYFVSEEMVRDSNGMSELTQRQLIL